MRCRPDRPGRHRAMPPKKKRDELHEFEKITNKRKVEGGGNQVEYEVQWVGGEKTWEPRAALVKYAQQAIRDYNRADEQQVQQRIAAANQRAERKAEEVLQRVKKSQSQNPPAPAAPPPAAAAAAAPDPEDEEQTALQKYLAGFVAAGIQGVPFIDREFNLGAADRALKRKGRAPAPRAASVAFIDDSLFQSGGPLDDEQDTEVDDVNSDASTDDAADVEESRRQAQKQKNALEAESLAAHIRTREEFLRRRARRSKIAKSFAARPPVNIAAMEQSQDAQNNARVDEIEKELKERTDQQSGEPSFGDRVVFFDLEWHKLDKKAPGEATKAYGLSLTTAHICQICAISANYSRRFNQYIAYRKLKPAWMRLVHDNILDLSPQDDPRIALSTEEAFQLLIDSFPKGCLFLSYGNTDAASIFKTLSAEGDYDQYNSITKLPPDRILARKNILRQLEEKEWRWANVMHWMKDKGKKLEFERDTLKIGGTTLGRLYDVLFHHSLWLSYPTPVEPNQLEKLSQPEIIESSVIKEALDERLEEFPASLYNPTKFGLVPREWLEVKRNDMRNPALGRALHKNCFPQFWNTSHLQPVFHVAHTDTIMMINCVAILCLASDGEFKTLLNTLPDRVPKRKQLNLITLYRAIKGIPDKESQTKAKAKRYIDDLVKNFAATHKRPSESAYNSVATSAIKKTWFFRKFQLALSENSAEEIWTWYDKTPAPRANSKGRWFQTTPDMRFRAYVLACVSLGRTPNKYNNGEYDVDEYNESYAVKEIKGHEINTNKKTGVSRVVYKIEWVDPKNLWSEGDWWEPRDNLAGARQALVDYHEKLRNEDPEKLNRIAVAEPDGQLLPPEVVPVAPARAAAKPKSEPLLLSPAVKSVVKREEAEQEAAAKFQQDGNDDSTYFTILQPVLGSPGDFYEELVMTKRAGKFTDKVKAIRSFLVTEAKANDPALFESLIQTEVPFSEKRQIRFPLDPKKLYEGLPWFSLQTSVAEPRTEMLHTLDCRNLSDPADRSKTRNFAEFEVFLWDFDIIIEQRMFINTRFRFCKECKEYTSIMDPKKSGNANVDEFLQRFTGQPQQRKKAAPVPSKQPAQRTSSNASSASSGSTASSLVSSGSARMSRSSDRQLHRPPPGGYPLTNLVSYFAIRSSLANL